MDDGGRRTENCPSCRHPPAVACRPSVCIVPSSARFNGLHPAHIRLQHVGHGDRTALLLVGLHDRDQRAADGDAGAVEGVNDGAPGGLPWCGSARSCAAPGTRRTASRRRFRDTHSARAARPRCRRSSARQSPCRRCTASPRGNAGRAGASTSSAQASMRSCSSLLCSGVVMETSSTLVNWCWRIMPRVSLPAAPASARKHGVQRGEAQRQRRPRRGSIRAPDWSAALRRWG